MLRGIWLDRNNLVFRGITNLQETKNASLALAAEILASDPCREIRTEQVLQICWDKPELNWSKINTDGSVISSSAGAGGVIRDHNGKWISSFSANLGMADVNQAEAWAILHGSSS